MKATMLNFITVSALLLAALYPVSLSAAGKGQKCPGWRHLSAAEQRAVRDILQAVQKAMPPVPEGWTSREQDSCTGVPDAVCDAPGFPLAVSCQASFTNEKRILESIQKFERSRSPARMEGLAAEMSEAAEKGDSKKLQKLQEEFDGLADMPAGKITARVLVLVNHETIAGNIRGGSEFPLPGAKYAYLIEDKKLKRLVFYLGKWNRKGEFGVYPEPAKAAATVSAQVIEVIIEGDIAEELARTMDLKALGSLVE
ncbi:MAG TPA: hypothetical protein PLM53_03930 [Spirochaetota bacterium]|nr:hypothetical protein [Spirochaetota bacterium]HPC40200.1 hypothetical protein [Spirochaetota bacterium]HPL16180.1 hypothetical protein [Spirochaetota bacterium]HQF07326.1 hypothetical protein [Spirochaetota bacterium]HQH96227.1 hypothetical protein [Spirochaetota bacterium]